MPSIKGTSTPVRTEADLTGPLRAHQRRFVHGHFSWLCYPESLGRNVLDVRQLPRLVEQRLLRTIEAEEDFEFPTRARGNPVRLLAGRHFGPEVDIHRTVAVRLQPGGLGGAARPRQIQDQV